MDMNAFLSFSTFNPYKTGLMAEFSKERSPNVLHMASSTNKKTTSGSDTNETENQIAPGKTRKKKAVVMIARVLVTFL